jgi:hypothetical protein
LSQISLTVLLFYLICFPLIMRRLRLRQDAPGGRVKITPNGGLKYEDAKTVRAKRWRMRRRLRYARMATSILIVLLGVGDALVLRGVIGPGWPLPVNLDGEMLVIGWSIAAGIGVYAWLDARSLLIYIVAGCSLAAFAVFLITWHRHVPSNSAHAVALPFTRNSRNYSPEHILHSAGMSSDQNSVLMWTAIGSVGSIVGGFAALISAVRSRRT